MVRAATPNYACSVGTILPVLLGEDFVNYCSVTMEDQDSALAVYPDPEVRRVLADDVHSATFWFEAIPFDDNSVARV